MRRIVSATYGINVLGTHGLRGEIQRNEQLCDTLIYWNTQHVTSWFGTCGWIGERWGEWGVMSNGYRSSWFQRRNECQEEHEKPVKQGATGAVWKNTARYHCSENQTPANKSFPPSFCFLLAFLSTSWRRWQKSGNSLQACRLTHTISLMAYY